MKCINRELYPFLTVLFFAVVVLVLLWPVLDMVVLSASLAVVLMPLHRRLVALDAPCPVVSDHHL